MEGQNAVFARIVAALGQMAVSSEQSDALCAALKMDSRELLEWIERAEQVAEDAERRS